MASLLRAVGVLETRSGPSTLGRLVIPTGLHILSAGCWIKERYAASLGHSEININGR